MSLFFITAYGIYRFNTELYTNTTRYTSSIYIPYSCQYGKPVTNQPGNTPGLTQGVGGTQGIGGTQGFGATTNKAGGGYTVFTRPPGGVNTVGPGITKFPGESTKFPGQQTTAFGGQSTRFPFRKNEIIFIHYIN